ncbi:MAG: EAL domain-containing protein [Actinomycetota bacterium]
MSLRPQRRTVPALHTADAPAGDGVPVAVMSAGLDGRIRSWNRAAVAMLGWNESDVVGRPMAEVLGREFLVSADGAAPQRHHVRIAHARGGFVDAEVVVDSRGDWSNGSGRTIVAVLPEAVEPVLLGAASTPRVRSWNEAAEGVRAIGGSAVCALVTVLGLKAVNVGYSRSIGDAVLRTVGERLSALVQPDGCCVRVDGDRFALVVAEDHWSIDHERRLLAAVRDPIATDLGSVRVSGCAGLAVGPAKSALVLLDQAEVSLNAAVRQGAGAVVSSGATLNPDDLQAARIGSALLDAMSAKVIEPHFQPVIDMDTGDIVMVEALARWRSDELGDVNPVLLISVAEDAGLIHELGLHILSCALDFIAAAVARSESLRAVAVNVSPRQLEHPDFVQQVIGALDARALDGAMLVLELTESQVIEDPALCSTRLSLLRDRGVRVAIDDFGTGRANLAYLTQIPIDIMKIDRRFVSRLGSTAVDESLVRSMIGLANDLGLEVVAEGVETAEQHAILRRLACRYAQGFLYSPARPAPEATMPVSLPTAARGGQVPMPADEPDRVHALRSTGMLDSPREPYYDDIARRAATICRTPAALITLIDEDRQWFKAAVGFDTTETARSVSFCAHTVCGDELLEIPDAQQDPRFATNPLVVGDPAIRFYAGVPLSTWDGYKLGTLCVMDVDPRVLDARQRQGLIELADAAARSLDARRTESEVRTLRIETQRVTQQLATTRDRAAHLLDSTTDGIAIVDGELRLTYVNAAAASILGWRDEQRIGRSVLDALNPLDRVAMMSWFRKVNEEHRFRATVTVRSVTDRAVRFSASDARSIESVRGIIITVTAAGGP